MTNHIESTLNHVIRYSILIFIFCLVISQAYAQNDEKQILAIRNASNKALKTYDREGIYRPLTYDVLITTGNGTLLTSKEALIAYVSEFGDSKMYWVRTPIDIEVNVKKGLAWETGTWNGYDPEQGNNKINGGNYSAMWTKESGTWLIKSQLFVTLE